MSAGLNDGQFGARNHGGHCPVVIGRPPRIFASAGYERGTADTPQVLCVVGPLEQGLYLAFEFHEAVALDAARDGIDYVSVGEKWADIEKSMVMVAEGVPTARTAYGEARKHGIDPPLLDT
ncbi:MAG: hypothetical protein ACKOEI_01305, partial [Chthoniobacterales bacterium]